jgi:subtilisin family serine protease
MADHRRPRALVGSGGEGLHTALLLSGAAGPASDSAGGLSSADPSATAVAAFMGSRRPSFGHIEVGPDAEPHQRGRRSSVEEVISRVRRGSRELLFGPTDPRGERVPVPRTLSPICTPCLCLPC